MSRTEGVHLPRIPTSHARVTSSGDIRPHVAAGSLRAELRRRSLTEPSYTAYVGTPRQDIPHPVFKDAAMYDDVFDKEGRLLCDRNTSKFTSPLNTAKYNSLNDPHCRKLFLNNRRLRSHLINLGLITDDLKVVATTKEQRQKIRAHELLERKEMLAQKLEHREQERLKRLSQPFSLPRTYQDSEAKQEIRRNQWKRVQDMKTKKIIRIQEQERAEQVKRLERKKAELAAAMEEARLQEQARRNAVRAQQEIAEVQAYEKAYGKTAQWHRESDRINNRMVAMKLQWSKNRQQKILSESFPPVSRRSSSSGEEDKSTSLSKQLQRDDGRSKKGGEREGTVTEVHQSRTDETVWRQGKEEPVREGGDEREGREEEEKPEIQRPVSASKEEVPSISESKKGGSKGQQDREELPQPKEHTESEVKESSLLPHQQDTLDTVAPTQEPQQLAIAEGEEAKQQLAQILMEAFYSIDGEGAGYLLVDDFLQVLTSRDLGFQLEENEQAYIANQVVSDASGAVSYVNVAPHLPDLLFQIFAQRAEQSLQYYGYYVEEQWIQIYPIAGGVVYLNKLTGVIQTARPEEYRPFLKDEVFEDSVVDFFESTDTDGDGLIDYDDFYNFLGSSTIASRVYRNQMEQLLGLYQSQSADTEGRMNLEMFSSVAGSLLLMIYQNAYPDVEEWIELESKKFGPFWLNKNTGETILPHLAPLEEKASADLHQATNSLTVEGEMEGRRVSDSQKHHLKSKKKKKYKKRSVSDSSPAPSQVGRPPKPQPSQEIDLEDAGLDPPSPLTLQESGDVPEVDIKPVSSRSRLIEPTPFETIPEEDEALLEDSLVRRQSVNEEREGESIEAKVTLEIATEKEREEHTQGDTPEESNDEKHTKDNIKKGDTNDNTT